MVTALDLDAATHALQVSNHFRVPPRTVVELWSKDGLEGTVGSFSTVNVRWSAHGQASIELSGHDRLAPLVRACRRTLVRVRIHYGAQTWDGRVWTTRDTGVGEEWRVTAECVGVEKILDSILVFPESKLGIEWLQIKKKAVYAGPVASGMMNLVADNAARLDTSGRQPGLPITVIKPDKLRDLSPWRAWSLAMESVGSVAEDVLADAQGWRLRVRQWLPGDPPPTTGWTHTSPRIVVDMVQAPWVYGVGRGETMLTGLAQSLQLFVADAISWVDQGSGRHLTKRWQERIEGSPLPAVVWQQGCTGVVDATVDNQHPRAAAAVVGGASPDALNQLISGGAEMVVTSLLSAIGIVLPGLGSIVGNALTNRVASYQRTVDHTILQQIGPEAMPEIFQSGTAFTLDAAQTARRVLFEHAGQTFAEVTMADGMPWRFGDHYDVGDSAAWWHMDGDMYVGPVTQVDMLVDREEGTQLKTSIGTPPVVAPGEHARRIASGALTIANALSMKY